MERGELYRVEKPTRIEPKKFRVYVIVSRNQFIQSNYQTVICAPVYTNRSGLETEVNVEIEEGLRHESAVRCDDLISLPKFVLTNYIGSLSGQKIKELNQALRIALEIENE